MRLHLIACTLLLSAACAKGSKPASPVSNDGGATAIVPSCEAMESKVEALYREAAETDKVAANLRSDFVSANLHMVLTDCRLSPADRTACLRRATSIEEIESTCLEFLDDQGTVEGYRFGGAP
jgi:hypothetical protein